LIRIQLNLAYYSLSVTLIFQDDMEDLHSPIDKFNFSP